MTAMLKLRLLSALILDYYLRRIRQWATGYYVVYDDFGVPLYIYVQWAFYRAVFSWAIYAALPPNLQVTSIEEISEPDDRYKYFCVGVRLNDH